MCEGCGRVCEPFEDDYEDCVVCDVRLPMMVMIPTSHGEMCESCAKEFEKDE